MQVQPHPPPPALQSLLGEGGRPLGSGGAEGRFRGPQAWGGGARGPLCRPPLPRPVGRWPAFCCPPRAPLGYTRAVGIAGRPRASGAARSAANGSVRRGGEGGGGNPPALVRAPAFPRPASEGAAPFALSWAPPVRRQSAAGRVGARGRFTGGACRGRGAPSTRVQRPLRRGCGAAVSSVCLRPLLGLRGRGGGWGGPSGPLAPPLDGRRGAAWRSLPRKPAVGWGVALFPRPPLPRARPSCRPSLGSLVPPAVAARRWPAGGGREGQRSAVSGLRGSRLPPALVVSALPPAGGGTRSSVTPYRGGGVGRGAQLPPPLSRVCRLGHHLPRRLCGGWGCGGGGSRRR